MATHGSTLDLQSRRDGAGADVFGTSELGTGMQRNVATDVPVLNYATSLRPA
jgi:hypothetical protein